MFQTVFFAQIVVCERNRTRKKAVIPGKCPSNFDWSFSQVKESEMVESKETNDKDVQEVEFVNFPPGSVIAFK